jgi:outer membrane protein assembly factor BamB
VSSPAVADGMVFAGSMGCEFFAVNQTTGNLVWQYDTSADEGPLVEGSLAVADGILFAPSYGRLYAFASQHDVAVIGLEVSKTVVGRGYQVTMNVTIENQGTVAETFNATVFLNLTSTEVFTVTLSNRSSTVVCSLCNTSTLVFGKYSLSVTAGPVPGDGHSEDNTLVGGWLTVTVSGDVNGDFIVDIFDAISLAGAYNSVPISPNWNPNADINGDLIVDIYDAILLANHYNQHYQ